MVADEVNATEHCSLETIDDVDLDRPFLGQLATDDAERLNAAIARATVVAFATAEYHGGLASVTKPVIENPSFPSVLAGKSVGLLGVAAGRIRAIKSLESLCGVCSHTGAIVLPGPISVAGARTVFDAYGKCMDAGTEKAIRSLGTAMTHYVQQNVCPRMALAMVQADARVWRAPA